MFMGNAADGSQKNRKNKVEFKKPITMKYQKLGNFIPLE